MSSADRWRLFGLDLSQFAARGVLAWRQLLYGTEAGLFNALVEPSRVLLASGDIQALRQDGRAAALSEPQADALPLAIELPEQLVLTRNMTLPASIEHELGTAVALDAIANSPFPADDLAVGWRILRRAGAMLHIDIAMASKSGVAGWLQQMHPEYVQGSRASEMWVRGQDGAFIVLPGYGEQVRFGRYQHRVRSIAAMGLASLALWLCLLAVPGAVTALRVGDMEARLDAVRTDAKEATRLREVLDQRRELMADLQEILGNRPRYDVWLDWIADETADDVYLQRLDFTGRRVEMAGLAGNAAGYLTSLAGTEQLSRVDAPSAFTRDQVSEKERFVIRMELPGGESD